MSPQTSWKQDKTTDVKQGLSIGAEGEKVSKHLLAFNCSLCRKEETWPLTACMGYTTDMQNLRPLEGGRIWALQKRISVYFVLEPINLKHLPRGTAFSHLKHSSHGDQAEVTGEQGHDLWYILTWLCLISELIVHEVDWINAHFMYIPKGNISFLTILEVVFSQTWLSRQAECLEKNKLKKKDAKEQTCVFSLTPHSHGAPQSGPG